MGLPASGRQRRRCSCRDPVQWPLLDEHQPVDWHGPVICPWSCGLSWHERGDDVGGAEDFVVFGQRDFQRESCAGLSADQRTRSVGFPAQNFLGEPGQIRNGRGGSCRRPAGRPGIAGDPGRCCGSRRLGPGPAPGSTRPAPPAERSRATADGRLLPGLLPSSSPRHRPEVDQADRLDSLGLHLIHIANPIRLGFKFPFEATQPLGPVALVGFKLPEFVFGET